jgi:hypothetical protein
MRRAGPGNRATVLPIPTANVLNAAGSTDKSDESEVSNKKASPPKKQFGPGPPTGLRAGANLGGGIRDSKAVGSRAHLLGTPSNHPDSSRHRNGESTDQYTSSASDVPEEMIKKPSHDSGNELLGPEDDDDDESDEKLKKKKSMIKVYQRFQKSYPEKFEARKKYYEKVAKSDILCRFSKPTPETLVECGYNTEHHNARLKKLETASFVLHFLALFFTIGYYEMDYGQTYQEYQVYVLYTLHGVSIYLGSFG